MKTDVIFLGAGASLSAGFPTNKDLTNYIIYNLSENSRYYGSKKKPRFPVTIASQVSKDWRTLKESLRTSAFLSVDEFCQLANKNPAIVTKMTQLLRMALFDH